MTVDLKRKAFMGIWRFLIPLPQALIKKDIKNFAGAICRKTVHVSEEERKIHRFVVLTMTETNEPVTVENIAEKLDMPLDRVRDIVDKLEGMKVFFYRYDSQGINWAYPVTAEDEAYKMSFSTGEQFHAAGAADAVANPFVQGILRNENLYMTINTHCVNSGKPIKIELDNDLNIRYVDEGSDPMVCVPKVNLLEIKEASIVDVFGRKSLFFWSEEDAREYQKKTRETPMVYLSLLQSAYANKIVQSAIFTIDDGFLKKLLATGIGPTFTLLSSNKQFAGSSVQLASMLGFSFKETIQILTDEK